MDKPESDPFANLFKINENDKEIIIKKTDK